MEQTQTDFLKNLMIAIDICRNCSKAELVKTGEIINEIIAIKFKMENIAAKRGYSQACKNSIPTCRGECCKWHFPKNLTHIDFLIAIYNMSLNKQANLIRLISENGKHQCPMLLETGCFLSFEQRPVTCTNAYPCFSDRSYWMEKEKASVQIQNLSKTLSRA